MLMEVNDVRVNKSVVRFISVSNLMFPDLLKKDTRFITFLVRHDTDPTLSKTF